jgi:hypothetical protein
MLVLLHSPVAAVGHSSESRGRRCLCKRGCKAAALFGHAAIERAELVWTVAGMAPAFGWLRELKVCFQVR